MSVHCPKPPTASSLPPSLYPSTFGDMLLHSCATNRRMQVYWFRLRERTVERERERYIEGEWAGIGVRLWCSGNYVAFAFRIWWCGQPGSRQLAAGGKREAASGKRQAAWLCGWKCAVRDGRTRGQSEERRSGAELGGVVMGGQFENSMWSPDKHMYVCICCIHWEKIWINNIINVNCRLGFEWNRKSRLRSEQLHIN